MSQHSGDKRARITVLLDGPYVVENVGTLEDPYGKQLATGQVVRLCRCGASSAKPYCDMSHISSGFSGEQETSPAPDRIRDYPAEHITVHDNRWICSHVGYCYGGLPQVFAPGERPWIDPTAAGEDQIVETVDKCPSGALSYSRDGVLHRDHQGREPRIRVDKNGAYQVAGGPALESQQGDCRPVSSEHYSLCRCGNSKNKPFCDGSHRLAGFRDPES